MRGGAARFALLVCGLGSVYLEVMADTAQKPKTDQIVDVLGAAGAAMTTSQIADATGFEHAKVASTLSNLVGSGRIARVGLSTYASPGAGVVPSGSQPAKAASKRTAARKASARKAVAKKATAKRARSTTTANKATSTVADASTSRSRPSRSKAAAKTSTAKSSSKRSRAATVRRQNRGRSVTPAVEAVVDADVTVAPEFVSLGTFDGQVLLRDRDGNLWSARPAHISAD